MVDSRKSNACSSDGENPNQADIDGETPLHAAGRWGTLDVVEAADPHGADIGSKALYGMTPFRVAVEQAQLGAARALLTAPGGCEHARPVWQIPIA